MPIPSRLYSLSLPSQGDEQLGDTPASDTVGLSLFLFVPLHFEDDHNMEVVACKSFGSCGLRRRYGATDGPGLMTHTC